MPDPLSDAGAIAARIGNKYQDHVAAMLVLHMIADRRISQVECETSDDITLNWTTQDGTFPEYVQVKTTDKDNSWTISELVHRDDKTRPTSIIEKSLLTDTGLPNPRFRIVARRGVGKALKALTDPLELRADLNQIGALAIKLKSKFKKTKSLNGHDLEYWTNNCLWQVLPGIDYLENQNLQMLSRIAEEAGGNPSHSHAQRIYNDLLQLVEKTANATKRTPAEKIITRQQALIWWEGHLAETAAAQKKSSKPYRTRGDSFFVEIHTISEESIRRHGSGFDAQYELKVWRSAQLAEYLVRWIPEITLRASELVEIDQLNLRQKLETALKVIKARRDIDVSSLISELLLHCTLRHFLGTEPIACKLFYQSHLGGKIVGTAHIRLNPAGDELWLGRAHMLESLEAEVLTTKITSTLKDALAPELLNEERQIILQLREPQHLTTHDLDHALTSGTPVDAMIKVLCLPLLFVYDSGVLAPGFSEDYKERLTKEIHSAYSTIRDALPQSLREVKVHIFLVPVESFARLKQQFSAQLDNL